MSNYIIHNGQFYDADELTHYGVPGMKWGVRKSEYKAMSKAERKAARKAYRRSPEGRQARAIGLGHLFGGLPGAIGAAVANKIQTRQSGKNKTANGDAPAKSGKTKLTAKQAKTGESFVTKNSKKKTSGLLLAVTSEDAKRLGLNESTRVTGEQEAAYWRALAEAQGAIKR